MIYVLYVQLSMFTVCTGSTQCVVLVNQWRYVPHVNTYSYLCMYVCVRKCDNPIFGILLKS